MFDLGWTELMVVGIVALIVVGPKDLPVLFRNVGRFVGKAKGMAREFSRAMNDAADEAGVKDMAQGLKAATNPVGSAMDGVKEAAQDMAKSIDPTKFDPDSETGKLAAERAADAKKIQEATARAASDRQAREAEEAAAAAEAAQPGAGEPDQDKETKS
ncbi:MAG: Sec-independent protein translocase protein TatB [Pseudophaeobacter sp. bin_em_oilr2.035]|mgnify:CR=1 FL=1|uniref:Sec-independent protein translocase protein TatB n=1 Tax=Phaeobacter gallaeciensis TaxID=60890 RepID=A0ABD4X4P6_9RHOB|nr:Sec-independent protein translocase protein TatB [Phaeobacter gallaeciensis]MDF1770563.1 Sec-independent protein translocase protein TatB [Pseudophaeobacter sp. bin_em_oilr2.035]MDE4143099.1 Sec-independent protein translocase protein TatB [Phaeobacter gallaeciensis]MDE4156539.1 Sec-independent protein translocase protein TatB [Phaeobacter gallaeciensis]MDE4160726.1 Sec-independent protein translocase protein TatB [Phaeobacter gallaeciensis]MDE4164180.1 Sec-independent protein translocase p